MNNHPAVISAIVMIQNHALTDKKVNPIECTAPPTNPAACSAIGILPIPWYKKIHPIRRRKTNKPRAFVLHFVM